MTTIYLSSTYDDLKEYRTAVFEALRKAGYDVLAMEYYVATDIRPVEKCLADVAEADVYVGLFAFRYGYVPPPAHSNPNGLSITELEFRLAERRRIPCLVFVMAEEAAALKFVDVYTDKENKGERINRLRQYLLTEKTASFFSSPYKLASDVQAAVTKQLKEIKKAYAPSIKEPEPSQGITWDIEKNGSPYPGLMHFTRDYAPVFFGREAEVREILDRMTTPEGRFIIVSGGSGTGKSSLVDAGILPRLEQTGVAGVGTCFRVRMVPNQGDHPFDALTRVMHFQVEQVGFNAYDLGKELLAQPTIFHERIQTIISKGMNNKAFVLFLDQMEELFTAQAKDHAMPFLSALYNAANETGLRIIATIRSDSLHHCHEHPEMLKVLRGSGHYPLGRVEPYMMHDMIVKPAACAGLIVPERLVSRLVQDTGSEPGNLPLLAFVLRRMFDRRSGNSLSEAVYDALGGVAGAISDHINTVEKEMIEKAVGGGSLDFLPRIFQSLLVVNQAGQPTRRRFPIANVSEDLRPIVDVLIKERLLSTEGERETAMVSVAHEKLFVTWPRLARWIGENQNDLFVLWRAEIEAREWEKKGFDLNYLWRVDRLKELREILKKMSDRKVDPIVKTYVSPQDKLIKLLKDSSLSHQEWFTIGQYLAELGDPRPGVGLREDGLPDIEWIEIKPGSVQLEGVKKVFEVKKRFRIAKYPVTNMQFKAFIDAEDGYGNADWWIRIKQSEAPTESSWKEANLPRESVSWFEAVAFCRWLSKRTGLRIRLPTEWEWQQAATGGDPERDYPWSGGWDPARSNSYESRLNRTSAVGVYLNGTTKQEVMDMAGNVWEWCLNKYEEPDAPQSLHIDNDDRGQRVIRGGSWRNAPGILHLCFRGRTYAHVRSSSIGFRLAQDID